MWGQNNPAAAAAAAAAMEEMLRTKMKMQVGQQNHFMYDDYESS